MSEIAVSRSDLGRTLDARPGDLVVIRIEENLTTGYGWEVEPFADTVLALAESSYVEATDRAMGRGGMRSVRFVARAPGSQQVRLQLRRPWDPPEKAIEQFSVTIRVR